MSPIKILGMYSMLWIEGKRCLKIPFYALHGAIK